MLVFWWVWDIVKCLVFVVVFSVIIDIVRLFFFSMFFFCIILFGLIVIRKYVLFFLQKLYMWVGFGVCFGRSFLYVVIQFLFSFRVFIDLFVFRFQFSFFYIIDVMMSFLYNLQYGFCCQVFQFMFRCLFIFVFEDIGVFNRKEWDIYFCF